MIKESKQRQVIDLDDAHVQLQELHRIEYPNGAPELFERLLPKLPAYIQALVIRKIYLLIEQDTGMTISIEEKASRETLQEILERVDARENEGRSHEDHISTKKTLSMFLNMQVLRALRDIGRDSVLSNDEHTIEHIDIIPPIVAHDLIAAAASERSPEILQRIGCVFFDVDGTKTIVDGTSHAHAGKYLESIAKFLGKPDEKVQVWLQEHGLTSAAYSVAGDELIVLLRSDSAPVTPALLKSFGQFVRRAVRRDPGLQQFISFEEPEFIMEYDKENWNTEEREAYEKDPASMQAKLAKSREELPKQFVPSISFGTATFIDGLTNALSPDTEEAATLEDLGINASRAMIAQADENMKERKGKFRARIRDPKLKKFLRRTAENRKLEAENEGLRKEQEEQRARFREKRREAEELLGQIGFLSREVGSIPAEILKLQQEARDCIKRSMDTEDLLALEQVVEIRGRLQGWCECLNAMVA